jgi:hypothetical protein
MATTKVLAMKIETDAGEDCRIYTTDSNGEDLDDDYYRIQDHSLDEVVLSFDALRLLLRAAEAAKTGVLLND